jgi:naphtho-gamma-pyrone polyketide synthase
MENISSPITDGDDLVDATDDRKSYQLFVFGDQTIPFEHTLYSLLQLKDDAILEAFFDKVAFHIRRYLGSLPTNQQIWFPPFTTLLDVVSQHETFRGAPAIKFALLCATEIGQFIR